MRSTLLLLFTIIPGVVGMAIFGFFALVDWDALQRTYNLFSDRLQASASLEVLFTANAQQNIHRINLFAEGVWFLLSAILAAIGLHGICTLPPRTRF